MAMQRYVAIGVLWVVVCAGAMVTGAVAGAATPCDADLQKFCNEVKPGGGAQLRCLTAHQADLSEDCKKHLQAMIAANRKPAISLQACSTETQQLCKDVSPGGGRLLKCLLDHQAELSPGCKAAVTKK
jgi:hypothetical protein